MARFKRLEVLNAMVQTGVIPVFYHADMETAKRVVSACAAGGARVIEFTNRGDLAHRVFTELVGHFATERPEVILGVGSIVDAATAGLYLQCGANFVVGPVLNAEVARLCNRRKVAYCPGCGSASEISAAEELGCEIVKVFPGSEVGGPNFVKSILGPCPWTSLMPTGGVECTWESLEAWFQAGVVCVGMGSNLITKELIAAKDISGLTRKVHEVLQIVQEIRK